MWHCVCACHKRGAADKKGEGGPPRTVKMAQLRTNSRSEWSPQSPECWMDKDQSQANKVCTSVRLPVNPSCCLPLLPCQEEAPDRGRGSTSATESLKDLAPMTRCACLLSSCMSISALSFSSLRKYCVVVAGWNTFEVLSSVCGSAGKWTSDKEKPGENYLRKKQMPLLYLENAVSVCLSLFQEPGWVLAEGYSVGFWFGKRAHSNTQIVFDCILCVWYSIRDTTSYIRLGSCKRKPCECKPYTFILQCGEKNQNVFVCSGKAVKLYMKIQ